jgi:hypothetical protein
MPPAAGPGQWMNQGNHTGDATTGRVAVEEESAVGLTFSGDQKGGQVRTVRAGRESRTVFEM